MANKGDTPPSNIHLPGISQHGGHGDPRALIQSADGRTSGGGRRTIRPSRHHQQPAHARNGGGSHVRGNGTGMVDAVSQADGVELELDPPGRRARESGIVHTDRENGKNHHSLITDPCHHHARTPRHPPHARHGGGSRGGGNRCGGRGAVVRGVPSRRPSPAPGAAGTPPRRPAARADGSSRTGRSRPWWRCPAPGAERC
jgi:hypothetical protein